MWDWVDNALTEIKNTLNDVVDTLVNIFVSRATQAMEALGLADLWNDLLQTQIIESLLAYAPLAHRLIHWDIVSLVAVTEIAIIVAIVTFKIIVKAIPTIW